MYKQSGGFSNHTLQSEASRNIEHMLPLDIPDVVCSAKITTEAYSQCESPHKSDNFSQYPSAELKDSACQSLCTSQVDSATQHLSELADAMSQCVQTHRVDSGTQWEGKESVLMTDASCQNEVHVIADSECQYENQSADVGTQFELNTQESSSQYDMAIGKHMQTTTNLTFDIKSNNRNSIPGRNIVTNTKVKISPIPGTVDQFCMKKPETFNNCTMTQLPGLKHISTNTVAKRRVDMACDPITDHISTQHSQTTSTSVADANTNTEPSPVLIHSETNTEIRSHQDEANQTVALRTKSQGTMIQPSLAEFGVKAKPANMNTFTNTDSVSTRHANTQTMPGKRFHRSTSTTLVSTVSRGVTAHVLGANSQTSTADLLHKVASGTQTQQNLVDSRVGPEELSHSNSSTNTVKNSAVTVACGPNSSRDNSKSIAVGTAPKPSQRSLGVNVRAIMTNSWTNPIIQPVSSKACGTDKVRHRHVGLFVRPSAVDSTTMTVPPQLKNASCGDNPILTQSTKQSDTKDLINYADSQTNTSRMFSSVCTILVNIALTVAVCTVFFHHCS